MGAVRRRHRPPTGAAVMDAVVVAEGNSKLPPPLSAAAEIRATLISRLSDLDRGARATPEEAEEIERLAERLEEEAAKEGRWRPALPRDLQDLDGRWRLVYTSAFAGRGGIGGRKRGISLDTPLLQVGEIHQVYHTRDNRVDTSVTIRPPTWLRNTGLLDWLPVIEGDADTTITLTQHFEIARFDTLRYTWVDGTIRSRAIALFGALRFPLALLGMGTDAFTESPLADTHTLRYCDGDLRFGVGARDGELRVYVHT